jgi:2'-5' RNA ligase
MSTGINRQKIRAFIACHIPDDIIDEIKTVRHHLQSFGLPQIRWTRPAGLHLTLKFLGDIPRDAIADISESMQQAASGQAPFPITAAGIGVFPNRRRPRVLWLGIKGETETLMRFQKRLDTALQNMGFPGETRPFKGHLTLGRIKGTIDSRRLAEALQTVETFESRVFVIQEMSLFQSQLQPEGAVYTRLKTVPLNA